LGARKPIPKLAIEVVITSDGPNKMKRSKALGVQEIWFWETGEISIYQLASTDYQKANERQFVKGINHERLAKCAAIDSRSQAVREFTQSL
jgi:Uma2 family endonuclease